MNDATTKSPSALLRDSTTQPNGKTRCVAMRPGTSSARSAPVGNAARIAYGDDAPKIERATDRGREE